MEMTIVRELYGPIEQRINALSQAFSKEIRDCTTPDELAEINAANESNVYGCATHDFMDANEQMDAAWTRVFGFPFLPSDGSEPNGLAIDLWNHAWNKSRENKFQN